MIYNNNDCDETRRSGSIAPTANEEYLLNSKSINKIMKKCKSNTIHNKSKFLLPDLRYDWKRKSNLRKVCFETASKAIVSDRR